MSFTDHRYRLRAAAVNLGLALATVAGLLGVVELTLRLTDFSFVLQPRDVEFGKPDPRLMKIGFLADDDLFWVTRDYPEKLARLAAERPPLILLGDSCTHLGRYDEALARLHAERTGRELAYGNLGVAGWSSYQGRRQLARDVLGLAPRVVTIYFGWNDHWIGFGLEDTTIADIHRVFSSRLSGSRFVQLLTKARVAWGVRETAYPNRVSRQDFSANLRAMVRRAEAGGIRPVLLTAASSHVEGNEPAGLGERWLRDVSELVPLHRSYVEAVRRVAAQEGAALCDLARRFDELPRGERQTSFTTDGIHLSAAGDRRLAAFLYDCFERDGLLELLQQPTTK